MKIPTNVDWLKTSVDDARHGRFTLKNGSETKSESDSVQEIVDESIKYLDPDKD
jgi:hypothetical protein